MTYNRTAAACFALGDTDQNVTVEGVPFYWNPATGSMDTQAAKAVAAWFHANENPDVVLTLIWVESSPAKAAA